MLYVDVAGIKRPDGWDAVAEIARTAVEAASDVTRAAIINNNADVWGALKDAFGEASDDKCWYCETKWNRDDFAMDHYRPKRPVHGAKDHPGYYWLCFSPKNLVFSCKYCNERRTDAINARTGGKGSYFPLGPGGLRAFKAEDEIEHERPILVSPIEPPDPSLIAFRSDGEARPGADKGPAPDDYERGQLSIDLYHLNHPRLVRARSQICAQLVQLVERCEAWYRRFNTAEAEGEVKAANFARLSYKENLELILAMGQRTKPYAGTVRSLIKQEVAAGKAWLSAIVWI